MIKKISFIFTVVCAVFLFSNISIAFDFNPGKYEITSKVEMAGMPGMMPAQTMTQCITSQDPIPKSEASGSGCTINNMRQNGNTVTWDMECEQQGQKLTSEGEMVYSGDTFEGTITTKMGAEAGNMVITTKITGTRIGNCTAQ
ncbi:MAG: DUF3617 domain-containing protein [Thermodesulfobacteriota bacterium]|nr:DUF3617 domain-containing protein [Thermodesulfobacteriota bacterium]